eukprot:jgi/Bigna1/82826/fgenesh1_pg.98_\
MGLWVICSWILLLGGPSHSSAAGRRRGCGRHASRSAASDSVKVRLGGRNWGSLWWQRFCGGQTIEKRIVVDLREPEDLRGGRKLYDEMTRMIDDVTEQHQVDHGIQNVRDWYSILKIFRNYSGDVHPRHVHNTYLKVARYPYSLEAAAAAACALAAMPQSAEKGLLYMLNCENPRNRARPNTRSYRLVMEAWARKEPPSPDRTEKWFQRMVRRGLTPDLRTYHALINASRANISRAEYWFRELQSRADVFIVTFDERKCEGPRPERPTYTLMSTIANHTAAAAQADDGPAEDEGRLPVLDQDDEGQLQQQQQQQQHHDPNYYVSEANLKFGPLTPRPTLAPISPPTPFEVTEEGLNRLLKEKQQLVSQKMSAYKERKKQDPDFEYTEPVWHDSTSDSDFKYFRVPDQNNCSDVVAAIRRVYDRAIRSMRGDGPPPRRTDIEYELLYAPGRDKAKAEEIAELLSKECAAQIAAVEKALLKAQRKVMGEARREDIAARKKFEAEMKAGRGQSQQDAACQRFRNNVISCKCCTPHDLGWYMVHCRSFTTAAERRQDVMAKRRNSVVTLGS